MAQPQLVSVSTRIFFDRTAITRRVDRAKLTFARKGGGLVRIIARRSIRKRKAISQPGNPPHSHQGRLRRNIFFGLQPETESAVIGPTRASRGLAPTLEYGGVTVGRVLGERRRFRIRARPFMGPALKKAQPKLAGFWKDSVRN